MHDLMMLIMCCGRGFFLMSPPTQLRLPQNLSLGCLFIVFQPQNKAGLQTPQNSGFSLWHPKVGFDWQDRPALWAKNREMAMPKRPKNCYQAPVTLGQGH